MRVTQARLPTEAGHHLTAFLAAGHHGDMAWMDETAERRTSPDAMWPEACAAILFALPYDGPEDLAAQLQRSSTASISVYAQNRDYHDVFKGKLKRLAQWFALHAGQEVKVFVDTAPLMEKPLAAQAGLGWQGKHSNLVSREAGNWFFIGSILTTAALPIDAPEDDHCGSCSACLQACPTEAFVAPYRLDARRCISYLTIEHKGTIPLAFRKPMGNRIYGCDDCLAACPWNKFARTASEVKLKAREDLKSPPLAVLLALDEQAFRHLFSGSPIKRIGRSRFLRNCLVAAGNSNDQALQPAIMPHLTDVSPLVRAMAVWALQCLLPQNEFQTLRQHHLASETDADVRAEWNPA